VNEQIVGTLICQPPGHPNDRHYHLVDEWWLVVEGEIDWEIEGQVEPVRTRAGDFVLVPANHFHHIRPKGESPTIRLAIKQPGENGVTYATLPRPLGRDGKPDPRFPSDLPNAPFPMLKFVGPLDETDNPVHRFYHMQRQYGPGADGVAMGKWVAEGTSGGT